MSRTPKILRQARPYSGRSTAGFSDKVIVDQSRANLASKYFVLDLPSATIPATRLQNILNDIDQGRALSLQAQVYLQQQGLVAILQFDRAEISYNEFSIIAKVEQANRETVATTKKITEESEQLAREAIFNAKYESDCQQREEARLKRESDPKYIAKLKNKEMFSRYGLDDFIEKEFYVLLLDILQRLEAGNRLSDKDVLWLNTEGKFFFTESIKKAYHAQEAKYFSAEYHRTNDPWNAVSASGHYRKCDQSISAHNLLNSISTTPQKDPKLNSAICTTHGGAMRDLSRLVEALEFGSQAHLLTPKNFRPCTLLGAVNFEMGNYEIGTDWYAKAAERGATESSIDNDLRGIFLRADRAKRDEIMTYLLTQDPVRYKWVHKY